jgi:hypothetical protein
MKSGDYFGGRSRVEMDAEFHLIIPSFSLWMQSGTLSISMVFPSFVRSAEFRWVSICHRPHICPPECLAGAGLVCPPSAAQGQKLEGRHTETPLHARVHATSNFAHFFVRAETVKHALSHACLPSLDEM